jgi:hypothetical protein
MKIATKGNKPDWLARPANVTAVNVCRMSGQLPNDGCQNVQVVSRDGYVETRSMIYTEYFVKGTQPASICPLHPAPSFLERLASVFGHEGRPPVPAEEAGVPAPRSTPTAGSPVPFPSPPPPRASVKAEENEPQNAPPKKKRGFWSRVFGTGKDEKNRPNDEQKKKPGGR